MKFTKDNKREIDRIIHGLMDVVYKDCSPTWKNVKERIKADEAARGQFIKNLEKEIKAL